MRYLEEVPGSALSKSTEEIVHEIVHDLSFERMDTIDRSPLQMLFISGLLKKLDYEQVNNGVYDIGIFGLDYPDSPIPAVEQPNKGLLNVLVTHTFFNYAFNDKHNLTTEECATLGYNLYAMGHDHMVYPVEKYQGFWVVRPGSFMRTSSHKYNLSRDIVVDIIEFKGTVMEPQLVHSREIVPSKPDNEVFSNIVYQRDEDKSLEESLSLLHDRVGSLLEQMDTKKTGSVDIFEILDSICPDPEVKKCLEEYLNVAGYQRKESKIDV